MDSSLFDGCRECRSYSCGEWRYLQSAGKRHIRKYINRKRLLLKNNGAGSSGVYIRVDESPPSRGARERGVPPRNDLARAQRSRFIFATLGKNVPGVGRALFERDEEGTLLRRVGESEEVEVAMSKAASGDVIPARVPSAIVTSGAPNFPLASRKHH